MEATAYAVALALLALVPRLGAARAKQYGDTVARVAAEARVDPWLLVAIGRVETNWDADNAGACCGGVLSAHWTSWGLYAEHRGLPTERRALEALARDPGRAIELGAQILASMRRQCGPRRALYLAAYQSGACRANAYAARVARIASRYRGRWARRQGLGAGARRPSGGGPPAPAPALRGPRVLPGLVVTLGTPGPPPGATTAATHAAGP